VLRSDDRSPEARTINVCIAPYGEVAAVDDGAGPYTEKFLSGAFREQVEQARTAPLRIWLNLAHNKQAVVGHATGLTELDGGLYGAFAIYAGVTGDKVLTAVREGALTGVSIASYGTALA
jgi:HK97 family phage prohead protease